MQGWLEKWNSKGVWKKWKPKWFELIPERCMLKQFQDSKKKENDSKAIYLLGAKVYISVDNPKMITIQSDDVEIKIKAETSQECEDWFRALNQCTKMQNQGRDEESKTEDPEPERQDVSNNVSTSDDNSKRQDVSNNVSIPDVNSKWLCVCAIDFGTTFSTTAFIFKHEFESSPTKASIRNWMAGGGSALLSEKCPTAVLIKPDGKSIEAFGFDAENIYVNMAFENKHRDFYFFQRFKMILSKTFGESLDRNMTIEDVNGRSLRALDVVAMTIKFLKDDAMKIMGERVTDGVPDNFVKWVLTIPAIWTDGAKQFMREAGIQAGISSDRLSLVLEPEAASVFCRHIPVESISGDRGTSVAQLAVGSKYLVLDAGGGTIDVTIHEVGNGNQLKEVHAAAGGPWGGTAVDRAFEKLMIEVLGDDVLKSVRENHMDEWFDFWRGFEIKKREITPSGERPIVMKLPLVFVEVYFEKKKIDIGTEIKKGQYDTDIRFERDKFVINQNLIRGLFTESINNILKLLEDLKNEKSFETILMVEGYSESTMLQSAVKSAFKDLRVVIPREASTAVVKGALIYGYMPQFISERVLKYTYGTKSTHIIREEDKYYHQHCEQKVINGERYCRQWLTVHAKKGQVMEAGVEYTVSYCPLYENQTVICSPIYASSEVNPHHVFDEGCKRLGEITVKLREPAKDPKSVKVLVHFTFSGTELVVDAEEKGSNEKVTVKLDFLG